MKCVINERQTVRRPGGGRRRDLCGGLGQEVVLILLLPTRPTYPFIYKLFILLLSFGSWIYLFGFRIGEFWDWGLWFVCASCAS